MRSKLSIAFVMAFWAAVPACSSANAIGRRCVNNETLCACDDGLAEENDVACNKTTFPAGACCAYETWPSKDATCTCASIACRTSGNGACACQLDVAGASGLAACAAPPGGACCINELSSLCACTDRPCSAPDVEVPDCTAARITGCAPGNHMVASCR
jgi:hypothetical protein